MSLSALKRRRRQVFYGWWMVTLGGFIGSLNKTAFNKGFPVFILPVQEAFDTSRATVSFVFSLSRSESGPTGPLAGWLIDRYGPRAILFVGAAMTGAGFLLLARMPNIWSFAVVYLGVITTGSNMGFSYSLSTLVNNWFHRRKGLAMSSYQAIDSFLPAFLVSVVALSIAHWGWRFTSTVIGIILLGVILPLSFFIKNTPEGMGLTMDGGPMRTEEGQPRDIRASGAMWQPSDDYGVVEAMRSPAFWMLNAATALRLAAKGGVILHIIPILVSKGTDKQTAAYMLSLFLFVSVPWYLIVGWLADRFSKNLVLAAASVSGALSFAVLASPFKSLWVFPAFILLFAVADASAPTNWAVLGDYFGRKTFSQLRGWVQLVNFPLVLVAPVFVGWWYDRHGSYTAPLWIFTIVFGLAALTFVVMRKPRRAILSLIHTGVVKGG